MFGQSKKIEDLEQAIERLQQMVVALSDRMVQIEQQLEERAAKPRSHFSR